MQLGSSVNPCLTFPIMVSVSRATILVGQPIMFADKTLVMHMAKRNSPRPFAVRNLLLGMDIPITSRTGEIPTIM